MADLKGCGIGGVLLVGEASEPLCQIPVGLDKIGMVLLGGLNPLAAAEEAEPVADIHASEDFRRHLVGVFTKRMVKQAWEQAAKKA